MRSSLLAAFLVASLAPSLAACSAATKDPAASDEADLSLKAARSGATVSRLPSGKWLLVGGTTTAGAWIAATELVDPATDASTAGPVLANGRVGHTATVLADGRVLVVGGHAGSVRATNAVEIVDVASGTVTAKAASPHGRTAHTATLLADGRVLVAGGFNEHGGALPFTSLYDPASDTWTAGPDLAIGRGEHTATRLADGSVVLAGGRFRSNASRLGATMPIAAVERFVPGTNRMIAAGSLLERRASHSASLLADGSILFVGGDNPDAVTDTAERLRPETGLAERVAPMGVARAAHRAVVVEGRVVVVGGRSDAPDSETTYQVLDVASGTWTMPVRLAESRNGAAVEGAGPDVFACGGTSSRPSTPLATCERIVPTAPTAPVPALARKSKLRIEGREAHRDMFPILGSNKSGPLVFDDARGKMLLLSPMLEDGAPQTTYAWDGGALVELAAAAASPAPSRRGFGLASDRGRGKVVLFGGERRANFNLAETWEWDGTRWTNVTPATGSPPARVEPQLTYDAARGRVLLFGGRNNNGTLNDLWSWDGAAWTELAVGAIDKPPASFSSGNIFAFDEARGVAVLSARGSGTWEWNGISWRRAGTTPTGDAAALVYDPARGAVVAHAASNTCSGSASSTLVRWDGSSWHKVDPTFTAKSSGCTGTPYAAFDGARGRMVLGGMWETHTSFPIGELSTEDLPNRAPRVTDVAIAPAGPVYAGAALTISVKAEDADGHALRTIAENLPDGAVLDEAAAVVRWTPRADQLGTTKLTMGVTDGIRTATREVSLDVQHFASALFPAGRIDLRTNAKWKGSTEDCGGTGGCRTSAGNSGWATCSVRGDNPGRVTITCEGSTTYSWLYDRFRGVWGSADTAITTSGEVTSAGAWSTTGGARAGQFSMSGTIRKDALGDLELCIGSVRHEPNGSLRATYTGDGCSPLYPVP